MPPNEDEALVFFVSRSSLGDMLGTVGRRGGAPLHYLLAYVAGLVDPGLTSLRLVSVTFAVASIPAMAALVARLSDRRTALVATLLAAVSWMTLHGVFGRMYSLFLFTSVMSLLLLLRALERGTAGRWAAWTAATLALLATQPYGMLCSAPSRLRRRAPPSPAAAAPRSAGGAGRPARARDAALANVRYSLPASTSASASRARRLGSPLDVLGYFQEVFGDFTAGWPAVSIPATPGSSWPRGPGALTAEAAFSPWPSPGFRRSHSWWPGRAPGSRSGRHLIFVLPFATMAIAAGLLHLGAALGRLGPGAVALGLGLLLAAQVVWGD